MLRSRKFKRETTHNGTLRTLVTFKRMKVSDDFYESNAETGESFSAWGEVHDVTFQDLESLKGRFSKNALALESIKSKAIKAYATVKIRDPLEDFQPKNSDKVVIHDERFSGKEWDVIDVQPDLYNRMYLVIFLVGS
ncbi:TPA: hypothetical protein ACHU8I_000358 [Streptococcus suis]|uniref:Phage head-tail adapter protein n=1 Tax=Streptococcus suis TaxID=1307 RepID=A0A123UML8_STRSU|nr:hypothetical protein [Streptococcus suis]MCH1657357.1 hypothetical protein [Streptococcus suis]MCH1662779.1 hypothetical protein [Streptococcus suis]MCH1673163.1 hypothetical protein [Streptococcus suis]MCL4888113.1 hypothetical protein [Streptococcus suis]MCL4896361.1 hypothetical protein [Streptococcus suis]